MSNGANGIFISYRREEAAAYAGWLADALNEHFGEQRVFRDIDSIEPGLDFVEAVDRAIGSSEVLLVVVDKQWLTATDESGRPRLHNPHDYVRLEVAAALQRNIRVVPLLVQGASMPQPEELPEDLAPLTRRNAFQLYDSRWREDARRLITNLDRVVESRKRQQDRRVALSFFGAVIGASVAIAFIIALSLLGFAWRPWIPLAFILGVLGFVVARMYAQEIHARSPEWFRKIYP